MGGTATAPRPHVVIVGAGPAGLWAARRLGRQPVDITLVDRNNYHTFQPLLWQVASGTVGPEEIVTPIRSLVRRQPNTRFAWMEVQEVDLERRLVRGAGQEMAYDLLVLATGSATHFYGIPGAAEHCLPLKTVAEAVALRNQVLRCFERAVLEESAEVRRRLLTFAVVGGGPTGVEFAGGLAELVKSLRDRDFPGLRREEMRVVLLEALDGLLGGFPPQLGRFAARHLARMGIEVRLGAAVAEVTPQTVWLKDGALIEAETVAWVAGVQGDPAARAWGLPVGRGGRIPLLPSLQLPGHPEVYVAGDLAHQEQEGHPLPMVWAVAVQQGQMVARNIARQLAGQEPMAFRYRDRGSLAVLGRMGGVGRLWGRPVTGLVAWLAWAYVHLTTPPGWRNRLVVALDWVWDLGGRRANQSIVR
jgi:NADH dehydrogenase